MTVKVFHEQGAYTVRPFIIRAGVAHPLGRFIWARCANLEAAQAKADRINTLPVITEVRA